jgi:hypothetical protein
MEILRFDDGGTPSHPRKKSSRGMLVVGLVATLFGISSAFASSTIAINGNAPIALGQGVTAVTACDEAIDIAPRTVMSTKTGEPIFYLEKILVSNVDTRTTVAGVGCGTKIFDLQIFNGASPAVAYTCSDLKNTGGVSISGVAPFFSDCDGSTISFEIPSSGTDGLGSNPIFEIPFADGPGTFGFVTLVSRDAI